MEGASVNSYDVVVIGAGVIGSSVKTSLPRFPVSCRRSVPDCIST